MNKTKYLTMAFAALFLGAALSACNDEDKAKPSDYDDYVYDYDNSGNNNSGNNNSGNNNSGNSGNNNSGNNNSGNNNSGDNDKSLSKGTLVDGYYAVDLGLSVKWATCNVGTSKPEEYGSYFAWGETKPKKDYSWDTYKYDNGGDDDYSFTKYWTDSDYGKVDNKTVLEAKDDAATANWGGVWRMPTLDEWKELLDNTKCTWFWTTQNGMSGYKVTSNANNNSIFLPATGYRSGTGLDFTGSFGHYWSSSLDSTAPYSAYTVYFYLVNYDWVGDARFIGLTVRAVCK